MLQYDAPAGSSTVDFRCYYVKASIDTAYMHFIPPPFPRPVRVYVPYRRCPLKPAAGIMQPTYIVEPVWWRLRRPT